jgi:amino acid adenylation domain-containing protein
MEPLDSSDLTEPTEDSPSPEGIAIVGMAGRFPGASDIEQYWRNLRDGVESISFWSREELVAAGVEPELLEDPRFVPAGGALRDIEWFDAAFFGFSSREAELMDPQQRLFLEVAWEALENAGYDSESYSGSIGIFGGMGMSNYLLRHLLAHPKILASAGPLQVRILNDKDFLVSLASFKMNLTGPSINVQTACSTSLVATVLACQSLVTYQCDVVLAGGSTILLPQAGYLPLDGVSSPDGHCRAFDASSQGTVGGSGAGVVVLKRLADALADGDKIHAVIKGFATNNDGSFKMGYTAPGVEGQIQVVAMAQAVAGIRGDSISFVETHGTGTPLGDPIEVEALTEVFRAATDRTGYCALGSVKTNIGHLDSAAGVASLIKTALALEHREIPPSLGFEKPNQQIDFAASPFYVNTELRPWTTDGTPRRAGVSSFAIGGVNAHLVVEEAPPVAEGDPAAPWQLLILSARTETALESATQRLAAHLRTHPEVDLANIAYTLQVGRRAFRHRRALVCRGREDALAALEVHDPRRLLGSASETRDARVAFLFPGLGNHHVGMARDLYRDEPRFREALDECAQLLIPELGLDLRKVLYPKGLSPLSRSGGEGPGEGGVDLRALLGRGRDHSEGTPAEAESARRLRRTELAQPAVFAIEYALARLLMDLGLQPDALLGFSVGEYVAACLSGVMDLPDALRLVARRAKLIAEVPAGAMLAVPLSEAAARGLLGTELSIAAVLGPELTVLAGPEPAVAAVEGRLSSEGLQVRRLETEHAFHSRMMEPIAGRFRELFRGVTLRAPEIPFVSNVTGTWITPEQATDPGYWADHLRRAVRFADGVAELWREPGRTLIETGPGQTLTAWALQHPAAASARDGVAVPAMRHAFDHQNDSAVLLTMLARLWLAGVPLDWNAVWSGQRRLRVALPTYPFERQRYWLEPGRPAAMGAAAAHEASLAEMGALEKTAIHPSPAQPVSAIRFADSGHRFRPEMPVAYVEPRDEVERMIAGVWRDLLDIDRVGVWDGFFDLGGDSLLATKLVTRLNEAFAAGLTLRSVFEKPTVADLAAAVVARRGEGESRESLRIPKVSREGYPEELLPVSFAQRRLWFLNQLAPGDPFYNVPAAAEMRGPVDPALLARCLTEIVRRHETLRTRLVVVEGDPWQVVEPAAPWTLPIVDLSALPADRAMAEALVLGHAESRLPFDLGRAPLLRTLLLRVEPERHIFLVTMHHVVSDGWSNGIFLAEMAALHAAYLEGRPSALPELPVQYADFAAWQLDQFERGVLGEQLQWWRGHLEGVEQALDLPTDRPRPPVQTYGGSRILFSLSREASARLRARGREEDATVFMVLLASMDVLLYRHTGQTSFGVGTPIANRTRREIEGLIGFFTNSLVLRADVRPEETFRELLRRTRDTARMAFQHQDLPFEKIVEELHPRRDLSRSPFFQVLLVETPVDPGTLDEMGLHKVEVDPGVARFDLLFDMTDSGEEIGGVLEFNTDLFDRSTAERIIERWINLLEAVAEDPDQRVGEVRMLGAAEWAAVTAAGLSPSQPSPPGPLSRHSALLPRERGDLAADVGGEREGRWRPSTGEGGRSGGRGDGGEGALVDLDGAEITYAELHRRANQLGRFLQKVGVGPEVRVALSLERSPDLLVSLLAILKAGGAYVPLDPGYPAERRAFMLEDSGAAVLLTRPEMAATLPRTRARIVDIGALDLSGESVEDLRVPIDPDQLAYVLYTSGSTGRPKGVAMVHGALDNLIAWQVSSMPGPWRTLQFTSLNFDVSYQEIFSTWAGGGSVVMISEEDRRDPAVLLAVLRERGVERLFLPFVALQQLAEAARAEERLPERLREVITAGEQLRITPALAEMFQRLPDARLHNHYGPTESHVLTGFTLEGDPAGWPALPPIGRPFPGTRTVVLDPHGGPAPLGVPGELFLGGVCLARGYLGRPDLTAERFVPDPLSAEPGARLYRTGDRARLRPDGEIEFLGRLDDQVKIRGYRVEPGEIEAALALHPGVAEAAVGVREGAGGDRRLIAWVVAKGGEQPEDLRGFLGARLPEYEVPSSIVLVDAFPLTPSGKVDRRKLAALAPAAEEEATSRYQPPRTPVEEILVGIWSEVLGVTRVGVHDEFFALGGHSLLATRVLARVRSLLGASLPVRAVFEAPTVAKLAERIPGSASSLPALVPVSRDGELPLSFSQERIWFLERLQPGTPAYHLPAAVDLRGSLDVQALGEALSEVVRRHEALRTVFHEGEDGPVQEILPAYPIELPVLDLTDLPEDEAERIAAEWFRRPFDLERGPLLRALVLRLGPDVHRLLILQHHIVSDGWSIGILVREVAAFYPPGGARIPELPIQYVDFAVWQRQWLRGEALDRLVSSWRERLAGAPAALAFPTDRPRPPVQDFRGSTATVTYEPRIAAPLSALARAEGATLFMALLAGFQILLGRWSGEDELVIGTPVAGREREELEGLIGVFINTLPLRGSLAGDSMGGPTFRDLVARARETALEAYGLQDLPFERLVEELQPARDLGRPPVFQTMLALQNVPMAPLALPGLTLEPRAVDSGAAKLELLLSLVEEGGGLSGGLEYNATLFDRSTVERLLRSFGTLLVAAVADPGRPVSLLPLVTDEERLQILAEWADGGPLARPEELLHTRFEARVLERPEAVALIWNGETITYGELAARAHRLAHHLRTLGVGPEARVGICLERSPDLVMAILAVLAAGGAYVPIEPSLPAARRAFLVEDTGMRALVTRPALVSDLSLDGVRLVDPAEGFEEAAALLLPLAGPDHLAYVIYTSGSTGVPKGVAIPHRSAAAFLRWAEGVWSGEELAAVLAATSVSFDLSIFELFAPLSTGGRVVLVPDALALADLPAGAGVTLVNTVPSAMAELVRLGAVPPSVRVVNLAGEPLRRRLVDELHRSGVPRVLNLYGPSEDTTYSTWTEVMSGEAGEPGIGRPIAGTRAHVLDRSLETLPAGLPGELFLAGDGLARGYLGRPALTAERFIPDPFGPDPFGTGPGQRLYRTGDLVRWKPDGTLEFLGRIDHQVKVRGFRIELGEIEAALLACPGITDAAVLVRERGEDRRIDAFVVGDPATDLRTELAKRLPEPMIPAAFVALPELPRTATGKLDRRRLAELSPETGPGEAATFVAPRTPVEERLAAIWAEVLGREGIGVRDNFFAIGGHSLLAARVTARVRSALSVDLPVRALFERPTIEALATKIEEGTEVRGLPPLIPVPRDRPLPLSFAQERIWFLERLQPGTAVWNMPAAIDLRGNLDPDALAATLGEIVRRHEALRTVFREVGGRPVQEILPPMPVELPIADLWSYPEEGREPEAERFTFQWFRRPLDLQYGPLLRTALLRFAPDHHRLLLLQHHIVSDGWSLSVLVREVAALYPLFAGLPLPPGTAPLPELPVQYADFAVWQREWLRGEVLDRLLAGWRERLAGAPPLLDLPTDRPRPRVQDGRGVTLPVAYDERIAGPLAALAQGEGTTLFMTLLAVFQLLLGRWSGQDDLVVGTPVAGRNHEALEDLIGVFINTLPLRGSLAGGSKEGPSFRELLARTRETALDAFALQDLPFEKLVEELHPSRDLGRPPIFQTMFVLQNVPLAPLELPGLTLAARPADAGAARLELLLSLVEEGRGLAGGLEYNATLFDRSTAERLLRHFGALLAAATADPNLPISRLPLLTGEERIQVLADWADGGALAPAEELLQTRFEARASEHPEVVALSWRDGTVTYGELNARADRLACRLLDLGVGPEVRVGICLERSPELVVAILAVLKAGGAYVPIEVTLPAERRAFMVRDTRMPILLTRRELADGLPVEGVLLVDPSEDVSLASEPRIAPGGGPDNLAYVIYTSGSTGMPKGVAIPHRSAAAFLRWAEDVWSADELEAVLVATSVSFDLFVFELFAPLSTGGRAVLVDNALRLPELFQRERVTLLNTVPSAMTELVRLGAVPPSVRVVNLAGEPLRRRLVDDLHRSGVPRILNLYGPSEDTTYSTFAEIGAEERGEPGIGRPIAGTRAYVLERHDEPVPEGLPGELFLAGSGLARGYLDRPDLTAERFVPDPFALEPGGRLYRTGDLVRWRASPDVGPDSRFASDAALEFLGRIDHQVKLRGFRIELGEIEAALLRVPGVIEAAVLVREWEDDRRLEAFVAFETGEPGEPRKAPDPIALRLALTTFLPDYMIPAGFAFLPALPLTASGKVDRRALARLDAAPLTGGGAEHVAPRTPIEEWLAAACGELLGRERVGMHDNFFDLGGHSLLATQLIARVRDDWGFELPLQAVFAARDLANLAERITDLGLGQAEQGDLEEALAELGLSQEELETYLSES